MIMNKLSLALLYLLTTCRCALIGDSKELQDVLCSDKYQDDHIELDSNVTYYLSNTRTCIKEKVKLTIISATEYNANLVCGVNRTGGFAFLDSHITVESLTFYNCGLPIESEKRVMSQLSSIPHLHFEQTHAATFIFINTAVTMSKIQFLRPYGFSIVGVNVFNASFEYLLVNETQAYAGKNKSNTGSGMAIVFSSSPSITLKKECHINIQHSVFSHSHRPPLNKSCVSHAYHNKKGRQVKNKPIKVALGISIYYSALNGSKPSVHVYNCTLYDNHVSLMGAVAIVHYTDSAAARTIIHTSRFLKNANRADCHGSGLIFYWNNHYSKEKIKKLSPLVVDRTVFEANQLGKSTAAGSVYLSFDDNNNDVTVWLSYINCTGNKVAQSAACVFGNVYYSNGQVQLKLISPYAHGNVQYGRIESLSYAGIFTFWGFHSVDVSSQGNRPSYFINNNGSAIFLTDTKMYVHGYAVFHNNKGTHGAAINAGGRSILQFKRGAVVMFTDNRAQTVGGAIYSVLAKGRSSPTCAVFFEDHKLNISFINNVAFESGNAIFGHPLYNCYISNNLKVGNSQDIYSSFANFSTARTPPNDMILPVSTFASNIQFYLDKHRYTRDPQTYFTYPGRSVLMKVAAKDPGGYNVFTATHVALEGTNMWMLPQDGEQLILEGHSYTTLHIPIYSNISKITNASLSFSVTAHDVVGQAQVVMRPCPIGFELSTTKGICECSKVFDRIPDAFKNVNCYINQSIIKWNIPGNTWIGSTLPNTVGISLSCPRDHCIRQYNMQYYSDENGSIYVINKAHTQKEPICYNKRTGILCGACPINKSAVFGSTICFQCTNYWLWTVVLYLVAGPLLIFLMFTLRLTITVGVFNAVIFYAQASNCGLLDLLKLYSLHPLSSIASVFILTLNLNLGFPLCFYNGMTELWKAGFSLFFPMYLLTIVIVLIIASRFSTWLSNRIVHSSVQVLVTVVHLSFSKLLLAVFDVFASALVYTPTETYRVWYWDGNVQYFSTNHIVLVSLSLLVAIPILFPYAALLLIARPLRRFSIYQKVRPILEAAHGPYKEGKQHWLILQLLLLTYLCSMYAFLREHSIYIIYIVTAPVLIVYTLILAYVKPFKNTLLNLLECWVMSNFIFLYVTTWYFIVAEQEWIATTMSVLSVFIIFITLLFIVIIHTSLLTVVGKNICSKLFNRLSRIKKFVSSTSAADSLVADNSHMNHIVFDRRQYYL